jgi:hypothetical protein
VVLVLDDLREYLPINPPDFLAEEEPEVERECCCCGIELDADAWTDDGVRYYCGDCDDLTPAA